MTEDKSISPPAFGTFVQPQATRPSSKPLAAAVSEKHTAFAAVYREYLPYVYRYALSRTGSIADAQDITSQTFLAGFEQFSRYQGRAKLSTWLLGIAHHKVIDHFRHQQRQPSVELDTEMLSGPSMETSVEAMLSVERIMQAMQALSADRREALSLHLFAELSIQETADVMQRSYAATQMLIQRGLADLRSRLQEDK